MSTVDLAGSEDPGVMVQGFLKFKNNAGFAKCDPKQNGGKRPEQLMNMYLASLSEYRKMAKEDLAYCGPSEDLKVTLGRTFGRTLGAENQPAFAGVSSILAPF